MRAAHDEGDEGVGDGHAYSSSWSWKGDKQAGSNQEALEAQERKNDCRVQENPPGLASPEALYANSKSWGAAAHKPWPLLSSSEREKKRVRKRVALRRLL